MSKVTQIPCTMTIEEINELKKCCTIEKTKNLFINRYKTSSIAMDQIPLEGLAKVKSQTIPKFEI